MRLNAEQSRGMDRAGSMRESGMFGSAARAEIRADRRAAQRAEEAIVKQSLRDQYGTGNFGDAFRKFDRHNNISGLGSTRKLMERHGYGPELGESLFEAFERMVRDEAKSEKQRQQEELEGGTGGGEGGRGGGADPINTVVSKLDSIIKEITERLPQNALS
jgi:hypothetical protein